MNKKQQEEFGEMKSDIKWIKDTNKEQNKKIDEIQHSINEFISNAPKQFACKKVEGQVQSLTNWKYWIMGGIALLTVVTGWLVTIIF